MGQPPTSAAPRRTSASSAAPSPAGATRWVLATKFGARSLELADRGPDGRPDYVIRACEASLRRLGIDVVDLYYQHRVDPQVPIEETAAPWPSSSTPARSGGSASPKPAPRRSGGPTPSTPSPPSSRSTRSGPATSRPRCYPPCASSASASSPTALGRGFLTGTIRRFEDLAEDDGRRTNPRFSPENFPRNLELVDRVQAMADAAAVTPAQLALSWVLAQGDDIVPIPGTTRAERIEENVGALEITLSGEDLRALDALAPVGVAAGGRYPEAMMRFVDA